MATLAQRLGFGCDERVAVVHADDIGSSHSANVGAFEALDNGPASCGSVMVPCPWFREAVEYAGQRPGVDLGVHLTLNSECPHYRWGPVTGARAVPSLVDDQGCLPRTLAEVVAQARPQEVEIELRAQIERALEAGLDVTHIDSHMGTVMLPRFIDVYARLAREYRLPVFAARPDEATLRLLGTEQGPAAYQEALASLEAAGIPLFDGFDVSSLHFAPGEGEQHNRRRLAGLGPGVSYLICHPARDSEELRAISDDAHMREFERSFYGGAAGHRALEQEGIRTVGMRRLRDLVRDESSR